MWALTVLSLWAISPLMASALLTLASLLTVFIVWRFVGFDVFGDE